MNREYDIIVFGATSFVGQIISRNLLQKYGTAGELKWAIAGRSSAKLEEVKSALGSRASDLAVLTADASQPASLKALCEKTRVVLTTVGPYALYGEGMVRACVETGTDYCDLTGEVQWIADMLVKYEKAAAKSGARIVNCAGFDSIPSDMGNWFTQKLATDRYGEHCNRVKFRLARTSGGVSGGTVASMVNIIKEAAGDSELRRKLADPYLLAGKDTGTTQPESFLPGHDEDFDEWTAMFVMAGINTRIVHRSNMLTGYSWGKDFQYDEAMLTGHGLKGRLAAVGITTALGAFTGTVALPPTRWLLEKTLLPSPGEGPSEKQQREGFFEIAFFGRTPSGKTVRCRVSGDADPGYGSTAKMISEVAAALAKNETLSDQGGFYTTAALFGQHLVDRLVKNAGLTFDEE